MMHQFTRYKILLFFLINTFYTPVALSQAKIEGIVADSITKAPIPYVTVYFANTTKGTITDDEGKFQFINIKEGTYELVFSLIGYEKLSLRIKPDSSKSIHINIKLLQQTNYLNEVVIIGRKDANWQKCFKRFKDDFLGFTPNAKKCTILNPELLHFSYDKKQKKTTGFSKGFLIIENKALGYKIKYELSSYLNDKENGYSSYYGNALFEEMPAQNEKQKNQWKNKRETAYNGSFQHFVRALLNRKLLQEGFQLLKASVYTEENILTEDHILKATQFTNVLTINYKDYLLINYVKEPEDEIYKSMGHTHSLAPDSHQTSALKFTAETIVASNGYIYNPLSFVRYGYWAYENAAEMLPLDYIPEKADK